MGWCKGAIFRYRVGCPKAGIWKAAIRLAAPGNPSYIKLAGAAMLAEKSQLELTPSDVPLGTDAYQPTPCVSLCAVIGAKKRPVYTQSTAQGLAHEQLSFHAVWGPYDPWCCHNRNQIQVSCFRVRLKTHR